MKATELKIGNWVYNSTTRNNMQVYPMMIPQLYNIEKERGSLKDSNINPITLSEEILLKCGFEKDDTGVDMFDQDYHEWCQKEFPIIGVLCQNETKEYLFDENTDTLRIRYLHQLQNLYFSLTQKELEVYL